MVWKLLLLLILVIWIVIYIKNKKVILALPYLLMSFITPFYNILDSKIFVKVFGCGCVPIAQTNMFNIAFNANNLRRVIYSIITILMFILGLKLSKKFDNKKTRILYNITIIIFNTLLASFICRSYMWN